MRRDSDSYKFFVKDRTLGPAAKRLGPVKLDTYGKKGRFPALLEAVINQQLSGRSAAAIYAKLEKLIGRRARPERFLAGLSPDELQSIGVSRAKGECIITLSKLVSTGGLDIDGFEKAADGEVMEELTSIKGVGPWTAHMFLIFGLKREDVWPSGDYGIRKNLSLLMGKKGLLTPREVDAIGERWKPYRSYAALYIWND